MVKKTIKQVVKNYLNALKEQGLPVRFGVIFGSQLTNKTDQWSDIDVLVISPLFDKIRRRKEINILWHTTIKIDSRIEPIPCGEDQWEKDDSSPIIEIARREGEPVKLTED
jgi:predicted nucleotidyltransferase